MGNKSGVVLGKQSLILLDEMFRKSFVELSKALELYETSHPGVFVCNDSFNGATTIVVKTTAPLVSCDEGDRPKIQIDVTVVGHHFSEIYQYAGNAVGRIRDKLRGEVFVDLNVIKAIEIDPSSVST